MLCQAFTILLHYFFLSSYAWLMNEVFNLYIVITYSTHNANDVTEIGSMSRYYVIGWGMTFYEHLAVYYYYTPWSMGILVSYVLASAMSRQEAFIYYCASFRLCKGGQGSDVGPILDDRLKEKKS